MNLDWKELLRVGINKAILILLTTLAARYTQWTQVFNDLMTGHNVSLYNGAIVFNLEQLQAWIYGGAIFIVAVAIDWWRKVQLKRAAGIALQLPRGATATNVAQVAESSNVFSTKADPQAVSDMTKEITSQR